MGALSAQDCVLPERRSGVSPAHEHVAQTWPCTGREEAPHQKCTPPPLPCGRPASSTGCEPPPRTFYQADE